MRPEFGGRKRKTFDKNLVVTSHCYWSHSFNADLNSDKRFVNCNFLSIDLNEEEEKKKQKRKSKEKTKLKRPRKR